MPLILGLGALESCRQPADWRGPAQQPYSSFLSFNSIVSTLAHQIESRGFYRSVPALARPSPFLAATAAAVHIIAVRSRELLLTLSNLSSASPRLLPLLLLPFPLLFTWRRSLTTAPPPPRHPPDLVHLPPSVTSYPTPRHDVICSLFLFPQLPRREGMPSAQHPPTPTPTPPSSPRLSSDLSPCTDSLTLDRNRFYRYRLYHRDLPRVCVSVGSSKNGKTTTTRLWR
ncbi:hypothetical protein R3P38DRAFT_892085 [Favolaschia claudopus]|uniref:Uncharacterized protein n=1 Tax=Favolaschia claudopus TaxID=2862362 RepID=A0AAW0BTB1_9AGAR